MSTAQPISQPGSETRPACNAERPLARRVRLVFIWFVIAAASFVAYRLGHLYAEWREVTGQHPTRQPMTAAESAMAAAMMPLAGKWSFDDLDWSIQSTTLSRAEVIARFETSANSDGGPNAEQLPDASAEFIKLAEDLRISPVARAGNQLYVLDQPTMKGQMVTRDVAGRAKVISLAAAVEQDGNNWQYFELGPGQLAGNAVKQAGHLLPLPPAARRSGGRFGERGELLLEMIVLDSDADSLLGAWRDAGWDVHETGLGDADAFSYLCVRGDDSVYVWSADVKTSLHNVMLVRTPSSVDTKAKP